MQLNYYGNLVDAIANECDATINEQMRYAASEDIAKAFSEIEYSNCYDMATTIADMITDDSVVTDSKWSFAFGDSDVDYPHGGNLCENNTGGIYTREFVLGTFSPDGQAPYNARRIVAGILGDAAMLALQYHMIDEEGVPCQHIVPADPPFDGTDGVFCGSLYVG